MKQKCLAIILRYIWRAKVGAFFYFNKKSLKYLLKNIKNIFSTFFFTIPDLLKLICPESVDLTEKE